MTALSIWLRCRDEAYRFARDRIGAVPLDGVEPLEAEEGVLVTEGWRADD